MRLSDFSDPKYRSLSARAWRYRIGLPVAAILVGAVVATGAHLFDELHPEAFVDEPILFQALVGTLIGLTFGVAPLLAAFVVCHRLYGRLALIRRRQLQSDGRGREVTIWDDGATFATVLLVAPACWNLGAEIAARLTGRSLFWSGALDALILAALVVGAWWAIMEVRARRVSAAA